MNLFLILLPLVVFASSNIDPIFLSDKIGTQHAKTLALSVKNALEGKSHERPADYFSEYFVYRFCDSRVDKEHILQLPTTLIFDVEAGFRAGLGSMMIYAFYPITHTPLRIRVQKNDTLIGGYQFQEMIVYCTGRGFN